MKKKTPQPTTTYYHGTSALEWEAIQREGLIPGKGKGGDYWAKHSDNNVLGRAISGLPASRPPSVYLSETPQHAEFFADFAAENNHSTGVVLAVTIPKNYTLKHDEEDDGPGYRYEGTIPPALIVLHRQILKVKTAYNNPFGGLF